MPYKNSEAQLAYQREWQKRYRALGKGKTSLIARRQVVRDFKNRPCTDCQVSYPYYVMQLDHINDDKVANLSALIRNAGMQKVLDELAKCEPVCANCHAIRTWERAQIT